MAEEYQILNTGQETEGGVEVPAEIKQDIELIADNLQDIIDIAAFLRGEAGAPIPDIDGNNSTIQIRRDTDEGWLVEDPILAQGEIGFITDIIPYAYKIGDGVSAFSVLPNAYDGADFVYAQLLAVQTEVDADKVAAQTAQTQSVSARDDAEVAATDAVASAQLAADWASAPESTPLPGGKLSSAVCAERANQVASISRKIELRNASSFLIASETMPSSALFKRTLANPNTAIVVTIPPDIFKDVGPYEAFATYRLGNAGGSVQFVPQGGSSGLITPQWHIYEHSMLRILAATTAVKTLSGSVTSSITLPYARLLIQVLYSVDTPPATPTVGCIVTGHTPVLLSSPIPYSGSNRFDHVAWEVDLGSSFAPATLNYSITCDNRLNVIGVMATFIANAGGPGTVAVGRSNTSVASVTANVASMPAQSLMMVYAGKRGLHAGGYEFSSFSSPVTLHRKGDSSTSDEGNPNSHYRNMNYGIGYGVNNVVGAVNVVATWTAANAPPCCGLVWYPPKSSPGAGVVNLYKANGDTLTVNHSEAELFFSPNGTDIFMRILP